jgi:hypothetical protein
VIFKIVHATKHPNVNKNLGHIVSCVGDLYVLLEVFETVLFVDF